MTEDHSFLSPKELFCTHRIFVIGRIRLEWALAFESVQKSSFLLHYCNLSHVAEDRGVQNDRKNDPEMLITSIREYTQEDITSSRYTRDCSWIN